ncbi:stemmadenine O-acetyltransferase-like [Mercurialis annua]|uniref:stemmadenine O-acetyltransferase-like n=1 Tax=Mercurialis annua TaxID=3986 RepID=UPI00215FEBB3|nr:stemmadenine O-acetyltransferase-like [Mercurialis annua]
MAMNITPTLLKTYKLSLLDQLSPPMYAPLLLFYAPVESDKKIDHDHFKSSLSKTLTHFYPFAGCFKDAFSVECNDHGVVYTEANVNTDISLVINQPDADFLQQLLPCNPHDKLDNLLEQPILLVRVNFFSCGGIAIGVCIWHVLANASALASFVTSWAEIARGADNNMDGVVVDCTSLFPPQDLLAFSTGKYLDEKDLLSTNLLTKRFVFNGSKLASLREKIGDQPTRVEALSAVIWGAVIAISQEKDGSSSATGKPHLAVSIVDLRKRMNPPLPEKCIGNINQLTVAMWPIDMGVDYNGLVGNFRQSIRMINDEYVRKLHEDNTELRRYELLISWQKSKFHFVTEDGEYLKMVKSAGGMMAAGVFSFSSWCKFPFYEADFGYGKPAWVGTVMGLNNLAVFIDAKDGEGIEVWISLPKEDMVAFEHNPEILHYASITSG